MSKHTELLVAQKHGQKVEPKELAEAIAHEKYAWPGGYELFGVTDDGGILCYQCCNEEQDRIAESVPDDGFYLNAWDHTENADMDYLICDHCERTIYDPRD